MGGDHGHAEGAHADFRTKVWSLTGGPYCRPKYWRRNTAIAMAGIVLVCIPIAMKSAELESAPGHYMLAMANRLLTSSVSGKNLATSSSSCAPDSFSALVQELWKQGILILLRYCPERATIVAFPFTIFYILAMNILVVSLSLISCVLSGFGLSYMYWNK